MHVSTKIPQQRAGYFSSLKKTKWAQSPVTDRDYHGWAWFGLDRSWAGLRDAYRRVSPWVPFLCETKLQRLTTPSLDGAAIGASPQALLASAAAVWNSVPAHGPHQRSQRRDASLGSRTPALHPHRRPDQPPLTPLARSLDRALDWSSYRSHLPWTHADHDRSIVPPICYCFNTGVHT
jgi:hypothetical protein